ncbi:MAG: hypothetical protein CMO80_09895 [Verrucomicrobiales bacterium]|nr:hypothetical protein [Verrucomicrobiales bacterium]
MIDFITGKHFSKSPENEFLEVDFRSSRREVLHRGYLALVNGARFYNDHAHPEYCTPECSTRDELAAHDRAGEQIVMDCAECLSSERSAPVKICKNNTDFRGHSYGCHENYLLPRSLSWDRRAS